MVLGLPRTRAVASYSKDIMKDISLAFGLASDDDYSVVDGGIAESATISTVQLAVNF